MSSSQSQTQTESKAKAKASRTHPPPLIIQPLTQPHLSTLILLHGRGSNALTFSEPLLSIRLPTTNLTLQQTLPHTKFIFPTSLYRRATFANRALITQWFDSYSLEDLEGRPEVEVDGLRESVRYVRELIGEEREVVGSGNVVLGGLSQGACVASLTLLGGKMKEEGLGAVFGMAGRLPLRGLLMAAMDGDGVGGGGDDEEDGVIFGDDDPNPSMSEVESDTPSPGTRAIQALRDELGCDSQSISGTAENITTGKTPLIPRIPTFLSHGNQDEKVPIQFGRLAAECLQKMGCDVKWQEYEDLGHWYHGRQLEDVVQFLREKCASVFVAPEKE